MPNGLYIVVQCTIVIAFQIQVVTILTKDVNNAGFIEVLGLGHVQHEREIRLVKEHARFFRSTFPLEVQQLKKLA